MGSALNEGPCYETDASFLGIPRDAPTSRALAPQSALRGDRREYVQQKEYDYWCHVCYFLHGTSHRVPRSSNIPDLRSTT